MSGFKYPYNSFTDKRHTPYYPGEAPVSGEMTSQRTYTSTGAPDSSHDGWDSNGIKQAFEIGDQWHNTANGAWYTCEDNSQAAAIWNIFSMATTILDVDSATVTISKSYTYYSVSYTVTGTVALSLPAAADNVGIVYTVADSGANAGTNSITVSRVGTDTIIGDTLAETSAIISSDGAALRFMAINTTTWKVW